MIRRAAALGLLLPLTLPATAQIFDGPIRAGIQQLQQHDLLPLPEQVNPMQPTGGPVPPPMRQGDLPEPGDLGPEGGVLHLIQTGHVHSDGRLIQITDGAEFTDRGYHCWADEVYGDTSTDTYTLKGNVRVVGEQESIYGDLVQVDFSRRTFVSDDTENTLKPALVKGRLRDNLYVKSHRSYGSEREVWNEHTSVTTCSYPKPHFEIIAENTDVRPGRRIIFRKVKLNILGHTVLNLPFLSVPLNERNYNNLPVVGRGSREGYFVKTRYSFPVNGTSDFTSRFDYFTKLGLGLGGGLRYRTPQVAGAVSVYTIQGPQPEFEILAHHQQNLGWGTLSIDGSYEDDNYLVSSVSKILNTRANLLIPQGRSTDRISFFRTSSNSPGTSSLQQTINVNDNRYWNKQLSTSLALNYSDNNTSFTGGNPVHREQVDVNFRAVDDLQVAQARLDYIRSIPIGSSTPFFTVSDVTPALTFLSDSRRLFGSTFDNRFPFQTQISYGEYADPITKGRLTRADFDLNFRNPNSLGSGQHWALRYQGEFKQDVYSDNTAQYVLQEGTQLTYNFRGRSHFDLNYNYMRAEGFTPLQIDRRGQSNNFTSNLSYNPTKALSFGLQTGYDFMQTQQHQPTPWQQVGILAEYKLQRYFDLRALSTYDTTLHAYSSTRFDLTWLPGATFVSLGAKYDGIRHQWAAANLFVDGFKTGRLRTSMLLSYNGYTKQFDAMHYSFIYDLHCAEAVLQYIDNPSGFNGGKAIYFFIRLKALPFDTPFGTGTQGQPLGTGTGRDF